MVVKRGPVRELTPVGIAVLPSAAAGLGTGPAGPHHSEQHVAAALVQTSTSDVIVHESTTTRLQESMTLRPGSAIGKTQEQLAAAERRVAGLRRTVAKQKESVAALEQQAEQQSKRCAVAHCLQCPLAWIAV